jgi:hypothetical protein
MGFDSGPWGRHSPNIPCSWEHPCGVVVVIIITITIIIIIIIIKVSNESSEEAAMAHGYSSISLQGLGKTAGLSHIAVVCLGTFRMQTARCVVLLFK